MISMEFLLASGIGVVTACGIWLLLRGRSFPVVLGLSLLGYAVNVFIFAMGRLWRDAPPILGTGGPLIADPLPQALVLTAIVIGFATTGFVVELALRSRADNGTDHVDGREPGHASHADGREPGHHGRGDAHPPDQHRDADGHLPDQSAAGDRGVHR
jgi:multicomponent K+:H+ antiporter subunit C